MKVADLVQPAMFGRGTGTGWTESNIFATSAGAKKTGPNTQ